MKRKSSRSPSRRPAGTDAGRRGRRTSPAPQQTVLRLQQSVGNRAVQGLLGSTPPAPERREEPRTGGAGSVEPSRPAAEPAVSTPEPASEPATRPAGGLIVPDETAELQPGQMRKSDFLGALRPAVCAAAEEGLAGTEHSARGCPWIDLYLRFYEGRSAERVESDVRRYLPQARGAASAADLVPLVAGRVRASVGNWARTGEVGGVPEGVPRDLPGMGLLGAFGGSLAGVGQLLAKARPGGPPASADPRLLTARLGPGQPLPGSVRTRLGPALGSGDVRVHTDAAAAGMARGLGAHAFTVGGHVAFGAGEYRPGTPAGDALIAHELAHVAQQRGAAAADARPGRSAALERDADRSAVGAVASAWGLAGSARPRLSSGLRLQRCSGCGRRTPLRDPAALEGEAEELEREATGRINTRSEELLAETPGDEGRLALAQATVDAQADLGVALAELRQFYREELEDAGDNVDLQRRAQERFETELERLRESFQLQFEMQVRWGIAFTTGKTLVEYSASEQRLRHRRRHWSREELEMIDSLLRRVPPEYLQRAAGRIRKIQRELYGESMSAAASWDEDTGTLRIYNAGFEDPEKVYQYILHEIGHSTVDEREVGGFRHLPPAEWMRLSDWRTSTWDDLGTDLGISGEELTGVQSALVEQKRMVANRPRHLEVRGRKVVFDQYEPGPGFPPRQFVHYDAAHDAEFVSTYARVHPAEDLAESFARYLLEPGRTEDVLDVGRGDTMDKWDYLVRHYPHRLRNRD